MKRQSLIGLLIAIIVTAGATYFTMSGRLSAALAQAAEATSGLVAANAKVDAIESDLTTTKNTLLGYTQYRDVLTVGKQKLQGQTKLLAARISRSEGHTRFLKKSAFGLPSNGAVEISYNVEYLFGYDLTAGKFDIADTDTGIEIRVGRPILLGMPAVTKLKHRVLTEGYLTDEKGAVIAMHQDAAKRALERGLVMAGYPEIQALSEKRLVEFFRDVMVKTGGVKRLPQITVVYK